MVYYIAQIIGFIAFGFSLLAYHKNKKNKILSTMIISNILNLIHYLLLGATSGCITKVLAIVRDIFIINKEKNKKLSSIYFLVLFIFIYIIISIYTYTNIISFLPLLSAIIYIIVIWNGNEFNIKKITLFCYFLWLIYNIFVLSISGIISNIISILSVLIAIKNFKINNKIGGS